MENQEEEGVEREGERKRQGNGGERMREMWAGIYTIKDHTLVTDTLQLGTPLPSS